MKGIRDLSRSSAGCAGGGSIAVESVAASCGTALKDS